MTQTALHTNIGERLTEARKRKGITVREASEVLKIRTDFLKNFENNRFDFDLPEVYMYGFLKLYAKYLKLDFKQIMSDYKTLKEGHNRLFKKDSKEVYGRIALPKSPFIQDSSSANRHDSEDTYIEDSKSSEAKNALWKKGIIFGAGISVLGIIFIIAVVFIRSDKPSTPNAASKSATTTVAQTAAPIDHNTLVLSSDKEIQVIVRQEVDKKRLFSGNIQPGTTKTISKTGPVKIHFSDGSSLIIEKPGGEKLKPGRSGVGWIEVS